MLTKEKHHYRKCSCFFCVYVEFKLKCFAAETHLNIECRIQTADSVLLETEWRSS